MGKTICDWSKKDIQKNAEKLLALTTDASFFCKKCGRVANSKKVLCNAVSFPEVSKIKKFKIAA